MSDWWTESRQNAELEDLRNEMAHALSETSSLRSRLSQIQGGLQNRVERLSSAFDAFVELSDLRYEMAGFLDAAELRRYASRVLSALASGTPLPIRAKQVPHYWLDPAVETLIALHGTPADGPSAVHTAADGSAVEDMSADGGAAALSLALGLDSRRTSVFLSLALAALGLRNQVRTEWLDTAFGVPAADGTLTRVQRVLWATAARGGFGADGLALVVKRLQSVAAPTGGWLLKLESRADVPAGRPGFKEIAEQEQARVRLARVRAAVEAIAGNSEAREPDRDLGYSAGAAGEQSPDNAAALLRLLISEGSEPEREPLARMAALRTRLTAEGESAVETLDDPAGTVEKLLQTDLSRTDEPHLAAAALQVIAPAVLPEVEALATIAGRPSPAAIVVENDVQPIEVRPDGADSLQLQKATASIEDSVEPLTAGRLAVPAVLAGVGAVMAIGLGFVHPLWIVLGLILLGIGAFRYWNLRNGQAGDRAAATDRANRLRDRCNDAATQLATYSQSSPERQTATAKDLTEIRRHLTA